MDFDYSKRGYLLPEGCKDLIDVIEQKTAITERGFVVTVQLPEIQSKDIEIVVEGRTLRIIAKPGGGHIPVESKIEVPSGYTIDQASATYIKGELHIIIPKAAA
jgi:HSP20 family molecular chaperone IbpA